MCPADLPTFQRILSAHLAALSEKQRLSIQQVVSRRMELDDTLWHVKTRRDTTTNDQFSIYMIDKLHPQDMKDLQYKTCYSSISCDL